MEFGLPEIKKLVQPGPGETGPALRRLMAESWERVEAFPRRSPEEVRAWQWERIRALVAHAYGRIPMYREKYRACGFEPGDLKGWEDFERLPVVRKADFVAGFPDGIVERREDYRVNVQSSGTSGRFSIWAVSPQALYEDFIQGIRHFKWLTGGKYGSRHAWIFNWNSPGYLTSIEGEWRQIVVGSKTEPAEMIAAIKAQRPLGLHLLPSYLDALVDYHPDLASLGVELIVVSSEQTPLWKREALGRRAGVPILDEYSSEELTRIALECPHREYHLEEDACYLEILDDGGRPLVGVPGAVVGTNLMNTATPFIRYHQGDLAAVHPAAPCACGNRMRRLTDLGGREDDCIRTPEGEKIPSARFQSLASEWFWFHDVPVNGLQFQFIQTRPDMVDLYLTGQTGRIDAAKVERTVLAVLPPSMSVRVHQVEALPETGKAKFRQVLCKLPEAARARAGAVA